MFNSDVLPCPFIIIDRWSCGSVGTERGQVGYGYAAWYGYASHLDVSEAKGQELSALGDTFEATAMVFPIRCHLDAIKRLLKGDLYIGRGSKQRSLGKRRHCNTFKASQYGRAAVITGFRDALLSDQKLYDSLWTISGRRLVCRCRASEKCHGEVLVEEFRNSFLEAYDRTAGHGAPPEPAVLSFMAKMPEEPESDEGSSPDEVPEKSAGHRG